MNELSRLFTAVKDGDTVFLEKEKVYDVRSDDSFDLEGYYCSNTATKRENPNGSRKAAIYLKEKKDITIDGNGASITVHGKMTPFLFDKCQNITVKNLTVDYAVPTMTEFKILANNNGICVIEINRDCLFETKRHNLIWLGENDLCGKPYWKEKHNSSKRFSKLFDPETELSRDFDCKKLTIKKAERINSNTLKLSLKNKSLNLPPNSIVQTRNIVRDQTGGLFQRCTNLIFENLRIKFMHGLGMVSQFCENVTYKNCDFTPKDGRTIASTADFFQFSGCKGQLLLDNCKACGAHDDFVNVHGTHLQIIKKRKKDKSIVLRFIHKETWGFQAFEKGDKIEFIKWDTLIPYYSATVVKYKRLNDTDCRIFLDRDIPDIELKKDVVENAICTPNLHIKNCTFGYTSGRGILCTTRGKVLIENNVFEKLSGPALLIEDDCNFWFESGYTKDVVFKNNKIIFCDYSSGKENSFSIRCTPKVMNKDSNKFVHGKLKICGNTFKRAYGNEHRFLFEYINSVEISDNFFDNAYTVKNKCVGKTEEKNNAILKSPDITPSNCEN